MIISSARFIEYRTALRLRQHSCAYVSAVLLAIILLFMLIVPEFIKNSLAESEGSASSRALNVRLTSTNADPTRFTTSVNRHDATKTAFFSTLTINATVSATSTAGTEEGYTLVMRSLSPSARLYRDHLNPYILNYIDSIAEPFSFNIDNKDIASSNKFLSTEVNRYGYSLDWADESSAIKTFNPVPTSDVVIRQTRSGSESDTTQVTFGFGVNHDMMSGNYYGEVQFTAIGNILSHTQTRYIVALEPGDATTPTNFAPKTEKASDTSELYQDFVLGSDIQNPSLVTTSGAHTLLGYNETPAFKAGNQYYLWDESLGRYIATDLNLTYKYENDTWSHFDGETYSPTSTITVNSSDNPEFVIEYDEEGNLSGAHQSYTKKLYAVWGQPEWDSAFMINGALAQQVERISAPGTFDSYFKMQDMSKNICESIPSGQDIASVLIDSRDNHIYGVLKARDDNCWMTDNLAIGSSLSDRTYYYNTTNIAADQVLTIPKSVEYVTPEGATAYVDWTSAYSDASMPAIFAYESLVDGASDTGYGNYYSHYLALAKASHTGASGELNVTSICPKGWTIPSADYTTLASLYDDILSSPLNFKLGGKIVKYSEDTRESADRNSMLYQGQYGMYWTSLDGNNSTDTITSAGDIGTNISSTSAHAFIIDSAGKIIDGAVNHRGNGLSVRCISDAVNNFNLHFDANGGLINIPDMYLSNSSDPATATFTLSTSAGYIPHRDSTIEDYIFDNVHYYYRHNYVFLGWHSSPTLDAAPASISAAHELIDYDYINGSFTPSTITVDKEHDNYSKILYAIWLDNRTLDHTETPQGPVTPQSAPTVSTVINEDKSDKTYVRPYGEDTIDDNIPSSVLAVVKLIRALPDATLVTLEHESQIIKVREAYEALSNSEKALIGDTLTNKYNAVLSAYYSLVEADLTGSNILVAAIVGAAVSTLTFTAFVIVKKEKDEDDTEED